MFLLDGMKEVKIIEVIFFSEISGVEVSDDNDNYGFGVGGDRVSFYLSVWDVEIIKVVSVVNKCIIVCIVVVGVVIMDDWNKLFVLILYSWYLGSEGGYVLVDVLLGCGNFSGWFLFFILRFESDFLFFDCNVIKIIYD